VIRRHAGGGLFEISNLADDPSRLNLSSGESSGEIDVQPGTHHQVEVP
jgi:hypothetical protein